ncbi:MAG TPA: hypothetical protein VIY86_14060, partial [Pirellulaceae bacterium]
FTFDDTLTQIGLGYLPLVVLSRTPRVVVWWSLIGLLAGSLAAYGWYSLPDASFNYEAVGVPDSWPHHMTGWGGHWNKNSNLGWAADRWFLNLWPRETPFQFHPGGYTTLNFVPTLATMLLGLVAGRCLGEIPQLERRLARFGLAGVVCLVSGWALNHLSWSPMIKRLWTTSFVLWSGGMCFLVLGILHLICDAWHWKSWTRPWIVLGSNSIVIYVLSWIAEEPLLAAIDRHFGSTLLRVVGTDWYPTVQGGLALGVLWAFMTWMYKRRIFVKL